MMNLSNFDLNLLVALDVLLAERNVTRAAERLHLSQSATSGVLQRLRTHFGDELLARSGREFELTPLARALVGPVRETIGAVQRVLSTEAQFVPATAKRTFRLMMSDFCSHVLVPPLLARLAREAPNIRCQVEPVGSASFGQLGTAAADLIVTTDQWRLFVDSEDSDQLESAPLFEAPFCCIVGTALGPEEPLTLSAFLRLPQVIAAFGSSSSLLSLALRRQQLTINVCAELPTFSCLPFAVTLSNSIAVLPRRLAEHFAPSLSLRVLDIPIEIPPIRETMIWHRRNSEEPAQVWLRSLLREIGARL